MDLSHSFESGSENTKSVKAELKLAMTLIQEYPDLRFVRMVSSSFEEIPKSQLSWLKGVESVFAEIRKLNGARSEQKHETLEVSEDVQDLVTRSTVNRLKREIQDIRQTTQRRYDRLKSGLDKIEKGSSPYFRPVIYVVSCCLLLFAKFLSFCNQIIKRAKVASPSVKIENNSRFLKDHPFHDNDILFSIGYEDARKETLLSQVKVSLKNFIIVCLVHDTASLNEDTKPYFSNQKASDLKRHFFWMTQNCDFLLCRGENTRKDVEFWQNKFQLPVLPSKAIQFGSVWEERKAAVKSDETSILNQIGVNKDFILAVGSVNSINNYETLYQAYVLLRKKIKDNAPLLVIAGDITGTPNLVNAIETDPETRGHILLLNPNSQELDSLYQNCLFTVMPSLCENLTATLSENLSRGCFCIASDVPSFREIGKDLVDYVAPLDPVEWYHKILHYVNNPTLIQSAAKRIAEERRVFTWKEIGKEIVKSIFGLAEDIQNKSGMSNLFYPLWFDLSLTLIHSRSLSGIARAEMSLARELYALNPQIKFFVFGNGRFHEVKIQQLKWLIEAENLFEAHKEFVRTRNIQDYLQSATPSSQTGNSNYSEIRKGALLVVSCLPPSLETLVLNIVFKIKNIIKLYSKKQREKLAEGNANIHQVTGRNIEPFFENGSIVLFAAFLDEKGFQELDSFKNRDYLFFSFIIYDFTPVLFPQLHLTQTVKSYTPFLKSTWQTSDLILYGGKTAQRDGVLIQKEMGLPVTPSEPIYFGNNIKTLVSTANRDQEILQKIGLTRKFLLSVGTIENRKNYNLLYKTYFRLKTLMPTPPQMVFVGGRGWHSEDFLEKFENDDRVKGEIFIRQATDEELDTLYRKCEFTLLPSFYEGWSLTLPESFNYKKLCLASSADPLQETGGDLAEYISPWDVEEWTKRIKYYLENESALREREEKIIQGWKDITWNDCARNVLSTLRKNAHEKWWA